MTKCESCHKRKASLRIVHSNLETILGLDAPNWVCRQCAKRLESQVSDEPEQRQLLFLQQPQVGTP